MKKGVGELVVFPRDMENREPIEYSNNFFKNDYQLLDIQIQNICSSIIHLTINNELMKTWIKCTPNSIAFLTKSFNVKSSTILFVPLPLHTFIQN